MSSRRVAAAVAAAGLIGLTGLAALTAGGARALAHRGAPDGEWRTYGGDLASTRYADLDQIDAANFDDLEVAWRFGTDNLGPRPEFYFQATPLAAGGVLYSTGGSRRAAFALDAATGDLLEMRSLAENGNFRPAPAH